MSDPSSPSRVGYIAANDLHGGGSTKASVAPCSACEDLRESWVCLICGHLGCGRYKMKHAQEHAVTNQHSVCLQISTGHVWDYDEDAFVHRRVVYSSPVSASGLRQVIRLSPSAVPPLPTTAVDSADRHVHGVRVEAAPPFWRTPQRCSLSGCTLSSGSVTTRRGRRQPRRETLKRALRHLPTEQPQRLLTGNSPEVPPSPVTASARPPKTVNAIPLHRKAHPLHKNTRIGRVCGTSSRKLQGFTAREKEPGMALMAKPDRLDELDSSYENLCNELEVLLASHLEFQRTLYNQKLRQVECDQWEQFKAKLEECDQLLPEATTKKQEADALALSVRSFSAKNNKLKKELQASSAAAEELRELNKSMLRKLHADKEMTQDPPAPKGHKPETPYSGKNASASKSTRAPTARDELEELDCSISALEEKLAGLLETISSSQAS